MYPPCTSSLEMMLYEELRVEPSLHDVENNEPDVLISCGRSRRALVKKGGHRVRLHNRNTHHHHPAQQHHRQAGVLRNNTTTTTFNNFINNNIHHHHHNSHVTHTPHSSNPELVDNTTHTPHSSNPKVLDNTTHTSGSTHLQTTAQKQLLKSKRERGSHTIRASHHQAYAPNQYTQTSRHVSSDNRERKRLLSSANALNNTNTELSSDDNISVKDTEKTYAGAKFSEPPSPSVLPKPPSHWVGKNTPTHSDSSREQMSVHLKTILKVQASPGHDSF